MYLYRKLYCPVCRTGHLLDERILPGMANLRLYPPEELEKAAWILKCPRCKNQIGLALRREW